MPALLEDLTFTHEDSRPGDRAHELLTEGDRLGQRPAAQTDQYRRQLHEAIDLYHRVLQGSRRAALTFSEAMTTSDFPILMGDILDRQLLAQYAEWPVGWRDYIQQGTVRDFRNVRRATIDAKQGTLTKVGERAPYPETAPVEGDYQYAVEKYGLRYDVSWEQLINDDLDAFRRLPSFLAAAARRTEERFATGMFFGVSGPLASFYGASNGNVVTGNPTLSIASLQTAFTILAAQRDEAGEPIMLDVVTLVVPPALEVTARNILNAIHIEVTEQGGTANQVVRAQNWMRNRLRLVVNPYIPILATTANGGTSWALFPGNGAAMSRPAGEIGFLRGNAEPALFIKDPDARRIGGGSDPMAGDFRTDSVAWKIRHVLGGTTMDPKVTVASNGSGS